MNLRLAHRIYPTGEAWIRSRRKRVSDLVICSVITPPACIIFVLSVVAIAITRGRPIFYNQRRVGRDGKHFVIHKLRTWTPDDRHKTNVGELLNILGADETPQIIYDIWRGKMGVIGARALIADDFIVMRRVLGDERYAQWYRAYTVCRPGWMSAFSQRGRRYVPQSREYLLTRYHWETWYHANARWDVDIRIFFRSLAMWCTDPRKLAKAIVECVRAPSDYSK